MTPSSDVAPEAVVEVHWGMRRSLRPELLPPGPEAQPQVRVRGRGLAVLSPGVRVLAGLWAPEGTSRGWLWDPARSLCRSGSLPLLQWDVNSARTSCYSFLSGIY